MVWPLVCSFAYVVILKSLLFLHILGLANSIEICILSLTVCLMMVVSKSLSTSLRLREDGPPFAQKCGRGTVQNPHAYVFLLKNPPHTKNEQIVQISV